MTAPEFILMLTRDDVTVPDSPSVLADAWVTGLRFVGFKDLGTNGRDKRVLVEKIHDLGAKAVMELVSPSRQDQREAAGAAGDLGIDLVIGGFWPDEVAHALGGTDRPAYYPYVGRVAGHPCVLHGSVKAITEDASRALDSGADGVNLLAFRYADGDPVELLEAVTEASNGNVIVAGGVDSPKAISTIANAGAFAFTMGSAIIERRFISSGSVAVQIRAVLDTVAFAV